jgi:hypothetical protein
VTFAHELAFVQSSNNLWIHVAPGDIWEAYGPDNTHWRTDLDYDGFYWHPATDYPFYWGSVNYPSFAAFQAATGLEPNGIVVGLDTCFENLAVPLDGAIPHQFMTLATGSEAIDAGRMLPGINDGYRGSKPDLGAYEFGAELPWYGPRPGDELSPVDERTDPDDLPAAHMAVAVYPNPFNPQTTIVVSLPRGGKTRVAVFDLAGRQVAVLLDRDLVAGEHRLNWRGRDAMGREMPSGAYFVKVATSEGVLSHKVTLVR